MVKFKHLLKVAAANMDLVCANRELIAAKNAKYANFDEEYEAIQPLEYSVELAESALKKLLDSNKADKEVAGKTFDELSSALKSAGYDEAVIDFYSELLAR